MISMQQYYSIGQDATIYANRAVVYALQQDYREAKPDLDLAADFKW